MLNFIIYENFFLLLISLLKLLQVCIESSKITHSHLSGINYSILQAAAVRLALHTEVRTLNPIEFVDRLSDFMEPHEPSDLFGEKQDNRKW